MRKIAAVFVCLLIASLTTEASAQYSTPQQYYGNYYNHHNHYYNGRYTTPRNYYENDIHHGYPGPGVTDPGAR